MENFYKITKAQADLIGKFTFAPHQIVEPHVGEQKDGLFLISERVYEMLKKRDEFKKVDFSKFTKVPKENLDPKVTPL